jgi:hypothetical protein
MVRHIVLWRFQNEAEGVGKQANLLRARSLLLGLKNRVPAIREFEVEIVRSDSDDAVDLALNSTFDSLADLHAYQAHPEHVRVVQFLRKVHRGKSVADYEL